MLYLACFAILYVGARGFFAERVARLDALAGKLYPALRGNDFDAWEMAANGSVALYAYDTDAQERRTIAQISLPPDLLEASQKFRAVQTCPDGMFFVARFGWDGERTGVFIACAALPRILEPYATQLAEENHYWLCEVPDFVWIRAAN